MFQETTPALTHTVMHSTSYTDSHTTEDYATGYDREYLSHEPERNSEPRTTQ